MEGEQMRRAQVLVCPDDFYFNPVFDFVSCEFTENRHGFEQVPSNAPDQTRSDSNLFSIKDISKASEMCRAIRPKWNL